MPRLPAATNRAPAPPAPSVRARAALATCLRVLAACAASAVLLHPASATEPVRDPIGAGAGGDRGGDRGGERVEERGEIDPHEARAAAGGDDIAARARLTAFTNDMRSFRASFEQTLYDADSEPLQSAGGTVLLKRPGRFVWDYAGGEDGEGQLIVADGERVWLYDRELAQVTVNDIDERVAGTPFVLLMGSAPLEEAYEVTMLGASEGIDWFELVPKVAGGDFEALYVGLDDVGLAALELRDAFGQATQIRFDDVEANVALDDAAFEFEVPDGVDVIGLGR